MPTSRTSRTARTAHRRLAALAAATVAVAALAGCAGSRPHLVGTDARPAPTATSTTTSTSTTTVAAPVIEAPAPEAVPATLALRTDRDLAVFGQPGASEPTRVLPARDGFGSPLALLVLEVGSGAADGWFEVLVPGRPNGGTGWVRAADVTAHEVAHEVRVDLASRTLTVVADDQVVLTTPVAIGDAGHPTPTGTFSLTDKLETGAPDGPYGPFALGLSGRSDVLTEFAGGDGQVGIHGTDDPSSIGRAASHGCIRVPNDVARTLSGLLSLGTPVTIA